MRTRFFAQGCVEASTLTTLVATFAATVLLAAAGVARADCAPVIAAYDRAEATKRYAIYEVDRVDGAPKGEPFAVTVGDVQYAANYVRRGPLSMVQDGYVRRSPTASVEGSMLKSDERKGEKRCETIGDRKAGGVSAVAYRIRSPGADADPFALEVWVDRSTGLPFFHGLGSDSGGFRWRYGADVVPPPAARIH